MISLIISLFWFAVGAYVVIYVGGALLNLLMALATPSYKDEPIAPVKKAESKPLTAEDLRPLSIFMFFIVGLFIFMWWTTL